MNHSQVLNKIQKIDSLLGDLSAMSNIQGVPDIVLEIRRKLSKIENLSAKKNCLHYVGDNYHIGDN